MNAAENTAQIVETTAIPPKKGKGLTVFLFVIVGITVLVLITKLLGIKLYAVTSSSMEPALDVGDVVVVMPQKFEKFKVDEDIITYYINEKLQTATHRVVAINEAKQTFITKGDNNEIADGKPVLYGNVVGKVVLSVPKIGYTLMYLQSTQGKLTLGAGLVVFVIILFLWDDGEGEKRKRKT